jgi:hypothetical protein
VQGSEENCFYSGNSLEGHHASTIRTGAVLPASNATYPFETYCTPVFSAIVGFLQNKFIPLGDMVSPIRIEFTLQNATAAFVGVTGNVSNYTVSEIELMYDTCHLNPEAARMVSQLNAGGHTISFDSWSHYGNSLAANSGSMNLLINARYSCVKTILTILRAQANLTDVALKSITSRTNPFFYNNASASTVGQWQYNIGGSYNLPSTPVRKDEEAYTELQKAFFMLGSLSDPGLIKKADWVKSSYNVDSAYVMGVDAEAFPFKSQLSDTGINTISTGIGLVATFGTGGVTAAQTVSTFVGYSGVLIIQNGVASVKF